VLSPSSRNASSPPRKGYVPLPFLYLFLTSPLAEFQVEIRTSFYQPEVDSTIFVPIPSPLLLLFPSFPPLQDHITLLNVYNAFTKHGGSSSKWCSVHRLNFKALSRAVTIRAQLKRYLLRFSPGGTSVGGAGARIVSCEGDVVRLRRCLGEKASPRSCFFFFLSWSGRAE
jgi:hypothetical protein